MLANRAIAGKTCPVCKKSINLGEPVRNCQLCTQSHHEQCWQAHGGCGTDTCGNAPPPKLTTPPKATTAAPKKAAHPGRAGGPAAGPPKPQVTRKKCPSCGESIAAAATKCRYCGDFFNRPRTVVTPLGSRKSGLAIASLCCGIASIVICFFGFIIGPVAIALGLGARSEINRKPQLSGEGLATAGLWTGIAGTVIAIILAIIGTVAEP
jgi:hypothetical protein